jgi:glucose/arabinose dehydrogenase
MMMRERLYRLAASLCVGLGLLGAASQPAAQTFADPGFSTEVVATVAPYSPVGIAWTPDGRLFIWQKDGLVHVVKNGVLLPTPFIDLRGKVNVFDDRGFWGLAFHPNFASNGYVYMTYVHENTANPYDQGPKTSRLVRVTANPANPDVALPGSELVILGSVATPPCSAQPADADCIAADGGSHTIGTIRFAPDGKLFLGNGDGSNGDVLSLRAQDLGSYSGKILRVNADGTAATDNLLYDGTNSIRSKVWLYGVRNPFRFAIHPTTSDLYFGEVGWNTWEEVDRGTQGSNYGWPCYEGNGPQPLFQNYVQCQQLPASAVTPPVYTYDHSFGSAAIGGPVYTGTVYPQQYRNNFFFADYSGNWIQRLVLDANGLPVNVLPFATNAGAPVTLEQGPDGLIYYISFTTGQIRRIRFNGVAAVANVTPSYGYSPLATTFSSAGSSDSGGGTLSYLWDFGDGTTSTLANPTHTYTAAGSTVFTSTLQVKNASNATASASVTVTVGSMPPTPSISAPAENTGVYPGQTVVFQGTATDPDEGALPASALSWTVLLHHNTHVHTFVGGSGYQGSFVAEDHGPIGTFSYEVILTATDSSGLKASTSVHLPVLADSTAPTAPSGLVATAAGPTQVNLGWSASIDNVAVTGYHVERCQGTGCANFVEVGSSSTTSYVDTAVTASTSYSYRVRANDGSSNLSGYSNSASATTGSAPPTAGLVAAFSFDEGAGGSSADASGNGNVGTINGATWSTQGRFGGALSFNGTDNTVRVPSSTSLNLSAAMTLEAWINPAAVQSDWRTIMQRQPDAYFLNASNSNGPLLPSGGGTFGATTAYVSGSTASPVGVWTHVALTYDGATLKLYVNGVLANSQARTGTIQSGTNPLWIGGNSPYGEYFQGLIDELRIYNRALTQAEIQADMTTRINP